MFQKVKSLIAYALRASSRLVSLAGFVFQACAFNHSDISPFRINHFGKIESNMICAPIVPQPCRRLHTFYPAMDRVDRGRRHGC